MSQPESPRQSNTVAPLTPDEIVNRAFPTSFRGLAEGEVRAWLARIAEQVAGLRDRERQLLAQVTSLQQQVNDPPVITEQQLVAALGDETTRVLKSAQDAAADIRKKAEERSVRIVREAQEEAKRLRDEADRLLGARSLEAEDAAAEILREGQARAAELRAEAAAMLASAKEKALRDAADEIVVAKERAKQIVDEAHALRDKLIGDLGKRRTLLLAQIDELRSGRERLLDAYRTVKRTLAEATRALEQVETRAAHELGGQVDDSAATASTASAPSAAALAEPPTPSPAPASGGAERPSPPPRPAPRPAPPLPMRSVSGPEGPAVRVLGPRPPEPATTPPPPTPAPAETATESAPAEPAKAEPEVPKTEPPQPEPAPVAEPLAPVAELPAPIAEPAAETSRQDDIEALFARIRAAREEALAEYAEPAGDGATVEPAPVDPVPETVTPGPQPMTETQAPTEPTEPADPAEPAEDEQPAKDDAEVEAILQRRDATLDPIVNTLGKRLKRALQDEQNTVLDGLRKHRGEPSVDALLPNIHEHVASYVAASVDSLVEAYSAGVRAAGAEPKESGSDLGALIENFARGVVVPLRERIGAGFTESVRAGDDEIGVAERLNARYREWKTQRIEAAVRDGLSACFAMGTYDATPPGEVLRWIVDDDGPCPDCDDNALEATPRGMPFPTGQAFPPAHPGCRCLIVAEGGRARP